jgi:ATP phosphoribosyltransferase regulatory subunit
MFKFQDRDGKILALRAEMTTPIARIVATKMDSKPKPLRLFYICNVFRYSRSYFENLREFHQAGVELIGCSKLEADGEVIALLLSSIEKMGLDNVRIDMGHAGLLREILNIMRLEEQEKEAFQKILKSRNTAKIDKFTEDFGVSPQIKDLVLQLLNCKRLEDLQSISLNSRLVGIKKFLRELLELNDILCDYGVEKDIFFDFSLTRKIEYYTGAVFEASIPTIGLPLGGGGRYDNLMEKFNGVRLPATGFAIEVEKCLWALKNQRFNISKEGKPKILVKSKSRKAGVEALKVLREAGIACLSNFDKQEKRAVIEYAKQLGVNYLVFVGSSVKEPLEIYDLKQSSTKKSTLQNFIKSLEAS